MEPLTPWLDPAEQQAWRSFVRLHQKLDAAIGRDMQMHSQLSSADYEVLVSLTDAPDGQLRAQELANRIDWEQSRLSHQIARMAKRGLVAREECAEDRRSAVVVITPRGRETIEAAAPKHVAAVRRLVIDALTPKELATLGRLSARLLQHLDDETGVDPAAG